MRLILIAAVLALAAPVAAQTPPPAAAPAASPANADAASIDAILAALYASISGDAGQPRDWDRFNALFHPSARLIPSDVRPDGSGSLSTLSPADYIQRAEPALMRGFHEREISRKVDAFGRIAHVFSTYDSRHSAADAEPFARGINSIQLWNDGARWWILSVYWQAETPDTPLPAEYLP